MNKIGPGPLKLICLLLLVFLLGVAAPELATQTFNSDKFGCSISYPSSFELVPAPSPSVAILLKARAGFPTFNILTIPGDPEPTNVQSHEQNIIDNYRQVGILDVSIIHSAMTKISGTDSFSAELTYHNDGQAFTSAVAVVPALGRHYVLTFIDESKNFGNDRQLIDQFWASFQVTKNPISLSDPEPHSQFRPLWGLFAVLLISGIILATLKYRRRSTN